MDLHTQFILITFLALFSTSFVCLAAYARITSQFPDSVAPRDAGLVLIPLVTVFLLIVRSIEDAIIAGLIVALTEFMRTQFSMNPMVRYGLWIGALLTASSGIPKEFFLGSQPMLVVLLVLFVLWFGLIFVVTEYSGRRYYDAILLPLFVAMHAIVIWFLPAVPASLAIDIFMLAAVMLAFALWREFGGQELFVGKSFSGFVALWLGYIWLQMIVWEAVPALLILIAYPLLSRIIGLFQKGRLMKGSHTDYILFILGSIAVVQLALATHFLTQQSTWMLVLMVYIVMPLGIILQKRQNTDCAANTQTQ